MYRIKEELKNITVYETPETDEAMNLLVIARARYSAYIFLSVISFIIWAICLFYSINGNQEAYFFNIIFFFFAIISIILYKVKMKPYWIIYSVARNNDKVRHEERIRFKERKRLETLQDEEIEIEFKDTQTTLVKDIDDDITMNKNLHNTENYLNDTIPNKKKIPPRPKK